MDTHEAKRRLHEGTALAQALGDVPAGYAFACELPASHGDPLHTLDRIWTDRFEAEHRDWLVILNGDDERRQLDQLGATLEAGAALVICDDTVLASVTPLRVTWLFDPDTGDRLDDAGEQDYWDHALLAALHARLAENGKDLPPLQEIVSTTN